MRQSDDEKLVRRLERLRDTPGTRPSVRRTLDEAIGIVKQAEAPAESEKPAEQKPEKKKPRLLTAAEVLKGCGSGWVENWYPEDPAEGLAEGKELFQASWCRGHMIMADGSAAYRDTVRERYNKRFGMRVWEGKPTVKQMADTPWAAKN